jgi:hypothetical protein
MHLPRLLRAGCLLAALLFATLTAHAVATWQRWETSLTASKTYSNAYYDVVVSVTFTKGSESFSGYAFWDGGSTWRLRAAFPSTGTWTWSTSSSDTTDTGLHNKSGTVSVTAYSGSNPLYQRGFLKVASAGSHLAHADDTPFLWIGDTAWRGPQAATLAQWKTFIDDRRDKKFTVMQVSPYTFWGGDNGANAAGQLPWTTNHVKINPAFWQTFDAYADYVNDQSLVLVLIGLPGWQDYIGGTTDAATRRQRLAQYLTGRYGAHHAIYSPASDSSIIANATRTGEAFAAATTRQLVTMHPSGPIGTSPVPDENSIAETYFSSAYVDFALNQSAHHFGNSTNAAIAARKWNLSLEDNTPRKPVINSEAYYEGDATSAGTAVYKGTAKDVRSLGWLSWTSGSLGYTYGVLGIWDWGNNSGAVPGWTSSYWQTGMNRASSTHMKYMAEFFAPLAWWTLRSAHSAIQNQPSSELTKMTFARNPAGTLGVAYLPNNASLQLAMSGFTAAVNAQWFNPVAGTYSSAGTGLANSGSRTFTPPSSGSEDWVLLLKTGSGGGGGGGTPVTYDSSDLTKFSYNTGWWSASIANAQGGSAYVTNNNATNVATVTPGLTGAHKIEVYVPTWSRLSTAVTYTVNHAGGSTQVVLNHFANAGSWVQLGTVNFTLAAGSTITVSGAVAQDADADEERAVVDAFRFTPAAPATAVTFEAENLPHTQSDTVTTYNEAGASGGSYDHLAANAVGDYVEYTVNVPAAGTYAVALGYKAHNSRGICQLKIDGANQGSTFDQRLNPGFQSVSLGSRQLSAGNHTFRLQVTGTSGAGYSLSADYISLTP